MPSSSKFQRLNTKLLAAVLALLAVSSRYFLVRNKTHRLIGNAVYRMSKREQRLPDTPEIHRRGRSREGTWM
jgi:hypothetical protein